MSDKPNRLLAFLDLLHGTAQGPRAVLVADTLSTTRYFWGDAADICGKWLPCLEMSTGGDCLCMVEGKGLVDVQSCDVKEKRA